MTSPTANLIKAKFNFPQVLAAQQVSNVTDVVYAVPTAHSTVIATATLCNTAGSTRTVTVHVVKSGQSTTNGNKVAVIELAPLESGIIEELVGLLLGPGDAVAAVASLSNSVAIVLSGAVSS